MHNVPPHQPVFYLFNEIPDLHGDSIEGYIDINSDTDYLEEFTGLFDQYEKISDYRFDTNKYKKFHEIFKVNIPSIPDLFTIDESFEDPNFIKLSIVVAPKNCFIKGSCLIDKHKFIKTMKNTVVPRNGI
mgnify:CR=1 FL=1